MPLHVKNVTDEIKKQMVEKKQSEILPSSVGEMDCKKINYAHASEGGVSSLITPGSSVSSERLASAIKCVVCDSRSRMTYKHVSVFLKSLKTDLFANYLKTSRNVCNFMNYI